MSDQSPGGGADDSHDAPGLTRSTSDGPELASAVFVVGDTHDVDDHSFRVFVPNRDDWLKVLASEYRRLRTETRAPLTALTLNDVTIVDAEQVEELMAAATVPKYAAGNFGVVRSDLAELALGLIQEHEHGCRYGYRGVRDRELVQLPGRGIDQIGVEIAPAGAGASLTLVLGEAKTSSDSASPPQVVTKPDDGLSAQHLGHISEREVTADKVWEASRKAEDLETMQAMQLAALLLRSKDPRLKIVASSMVVRPSDRTQVPSDFGSFHISPTDYAPAQVRFYILSVPGDIADIARDLANLALNGSDKTAA